MSNQIRILQPHQPVQTGKVGEQAEARPREELRQAGQHLPAGGGFDLQQHQPAGRQPGTRLRRQSLDQAHAVGAAVQRQRRLVAGYPQLR